MPAAAHPTIVKITSIAGMYMAEQQKTFGEALEALLDGKCVRRAGWNGKGMFVYRHTFEPASIPGIVLDGSVVSFASTFVLFTAQKVHQPGWNAAQPDMHANDWEILSVVDILASQV
jgi:hypothetical protein